MQPIDLTAETEFMAERPRTKMLYDSPFFRAVLFCLEAGQGVPRHVSSSEVVMQVVQGSGVVIVGEKEYAMKAGEVIVSRPNEPHGFRSEGERLVVLAHIIPSPA